MLFDGSEEDHAAHGLGIIPGTIRWIPPGVKRPQMQWNQLTLRAPPNRCSTSSVSIRGCTSCTRCTACRRSRTWCRRRASTAAELNAAFRLGNVFATQFHPEKSGAAGLQLLANFVDLVRGAHDDRAVPGDRSARRSGRAPVAGRLRGRDRVRRRPGRGGDGVRRRRGDVGARRRSRRRPHRRSGQSAGRRRASPPRSPVAAGCRRAAGFARSPMRRRSPRRVSPGS